MTAAPDLARRILAAGRGCLGIRWQHLGRTRDGLDCVGLVLLAYAAAGVPLLDADSYPRGVRGDAVLQHIAAQGRRIPLDPAQTGDLTAGTRDGDVLLFADSIYACHIGLRCTVWGQPGVLHAHAGRRRVREEPLSAGMGSLLRGAFRHPDLET